MDPRILLADLVVAVHVGYVAFVLFGQLAIVAGLLRGWTWVRNLWFRLAHLAAVLIVASESILSIPCPLTVWERELRTRAGQQTTGDDFIGAALRDLIFLDAPPWAFTVAYVGFALLVLVTFLVAPPRLPSDVGLPRRGFHDR